MATSTVFSGWTDGQRAHLALRAILGINIFTRLSHGPLVRILLATESDARLTVGAAS